MHFLVHVFSEIDIKTHLQKIEFVKTNIDLRTNTRSEALTYCALTTKDTSNEREQRSIWKWEYDDVHTKAGPFKCVLKFISYQYHQVLSVQKNHHQGNY